MKKGISRGGFDAIVKETRKSRELNKSALSKSFESFESYAYDSTFILKESSESASPAVYLEEGNILQREVRKAFGKTGINNQPIGAHPDFTNLIGTKQQEYHHVCSLFIDIKNSTRLSFLFDLEDVFLIKNSLLKAAIETVRSMDGHVHRLMGDALLAFFGSKSKKFEDSIIDAINCAALLESLMVGTFIPYLGEHGMDVDYLGFRIGLDFGPDQKVLWGAYGLSDVAEITATSFYVDVAAKLQSMAARNKAMLGESILEHIDFPSDYVRKKIQKRNGETFEVDHLNKTYTDSIGKIHRYKVRELKHDAYRDLLPYSPDLKNGFIGSKIVPYEGIDYRCYVRTNEERSEEYVSVSKALDKGAKLEFRVKIDKNVLLAASLPLTVRFTKRNHGIEAAAKGDAGVYPKQTKVVLPKGTDLSNYFYPGETIVELESTSYRGMHTMTAEVYNSENSLIFRDIIGIYIV